MKSIAFVVVALLALGLVGCGAQPGKSLMTLSRGGTPPDLATASQPGEYAVYSGMGTTPITTHQLDRGDTYGFQKDTDGKYWAVVKGKKVAALEGTFTTKWFWKFKATK